RRSSDLQQRRQDILSSPDESNLTGRNPVVEEVNGEAAESEEEVCHCQRRSREKRGPYGDVFVLSHEEATRLPWAHRDNSAPYDAERDCVNDGLSRSAKVVVRAGQPMPRDAVGL